MCISTISTNGKGGDGRKKRQRDDWTTLKSASTAVARHGAQWTRWRIIEAFGGYLPVAVSLPRSAGAKQQGDLMDKNLRVIRLSERVNMQS